MPTRRWSARFAAVSTDSRWRLSSPRHATGLDDRLGLLRARRHAGIPRHRTMRAVLDWSHDLLSDGERRFLRALGIFRGDITVEAATSVAADPGETRGEVL